MSTKRKIVLMLTITCCAILAFLSLAIGENEGVRTDTTELSKHNEEALHLGRKVLAVKAAIQNPKAQNAMKAIKDLGLDSRYYVMVRGWLVMRLRGDLSIMDASKNKVRPEIRERVEFLKKAIRAIDLE